MNFEKANRRELIAAVTVTALGALVSDSATAQGSQESRPIFKPEDAGTLHGHTLDQISGVLNGIAINTKEGLHKIVGLLMEFKVINKPDADKLDKLVDAIFSDPAEIQRKVNEIFDEARKDAGEVAKAIISIAKNSVEYAKGHQREIYIVTSDVSGALTGALTGAKFGAPIAVVGALAGAVASSAGAAFSSKK